MQANKSHLADIGYMLGLELKDSLTTEKMLGLISESLIALHGSLIVVWPERSREGNIAGCIDRINALHEAADLKRQRRDLALRSPVAVRRSREPAKEEEGRTQRTSKK